MSPVTGGQRQHVATDDRGVAMLTIKPTDALETLDVEVHDSQGNRLKTTVPLQPRGGTDQVLVRADRAIYKTGDRMLLDVYTNARTGSAYLDVVKDGQTMLTRDLNVTAGHASLELTAAAEMSGTLDLNVYRFGADGQAVGDHRLVVVQPADELHIEATSDSQVYKPGADASIRFRVTNNRGEAVHAALGLQVVDEAVFALAEKRPGFARTFFYLEQEFMKPRYEIHSLSLPEVMEPSSKTDNGGRDRVAQALFSATYSTNPNQREVTVGKDAQLEKSREYQERYRSAFYKQIEDLASKANEQLKRGSIDKEHVAVIDGMRRSVSGEPRDGWGTPLRFEPAAWSNSMRHYFRVSSAGPDRQFGTDDDFSLTVDAITGRSTQSGIGSESTITVTIEHDRGPFNGFAEVAGAVTDPPGAVIPGAVVTLLQVSHAGRRQTRTDAQGQFVLTGLEAGGYELEIAAPGFADGTKRIRLQPRDRASVSSTLTVGSTAQTVEIVAASPLLARAVEVEANGGFAALRQALQPIAMSKFNAMAKPAAGLADSVVAKDGAEQTHVRSNFPEALYINPEIITDRDGVASVTIPMADSITTWRMAVLASTKVGALGSATSSLTVFTDFFVDLDLPVTITQGDRVLRSLDRRAGPRG